MKFQSDIPRELAATEPATVYYDDTSDPQNPGWVIELVNGEQISLDAAICCTSARDLRREAAAFTTGPITIRR